MYSEQRQSFALWVISLHLPFHVQSLTILSNTVSYEFYQIMVGSPTMNIHGWRQLAEWSIEFSCLTDTEKTQAMSIFRREWEDFCVWIDREFGAHANNLNGTM